MLNRNRKSPLARIEFVFAAAAACILSACQSQPIPVGTAGLAAQWQGSTLAVNLEPEISVLTLAAAGERVLLFRGYIITGRNMSEAQMRLRGKFAGSNDWTETTVVARVAGPSTRLEVSVAPSGDQAESRAVMDAILGEIGL